MAFINSEVDVSLLPAAETVPLQKVHKTYLKLLRVEWLVTSFFLVTATILMIVFIPGFRNSGWWIGLALVTLLVITGYYAAQEKSFSFIAYAVRQHDVVYQRGWLIRSTKVCPYNRVQNCSIQSGLLERRSGLASLVLYTAGSEGADMRIPGLLQKEAEELRQFILSKINGTETV